MDGSRIFIIIFFMKMYLDKILEFYYNKKHDVC